MTTTLDVRAPSVVTPARLRHRVTLATFVLTSFVGSGLLFLVQPMVAKLLLPLLGGSPAVWNTAMVFFQATLLVGYAAAHLSLRRLGVARHRLVGVALLALPVLALPIGLPSGWRPPGGDGASLWVLGALALTVGAPFLALSTASPTLQRWFASTDHPAAADPYFLYAAGNAGSLLALLGYPFVVEPRLELDTQLVAWSWAYVALVVAVGGCALLMRADARVPGPIVERHTVDRSTRLRWVLWAFVPSALMLGVTRHIATDVASVPLLWVVPLALYLGTFVVAFSGRHPARASAILLRVLVVPVILSMLGSLGSVWVEMVLHLALFTAAALVAHGRLAATRPPSVDLTGFYLLVSVGGVLGGIATALVAPVVFDTVLEYPITIVLAVTVLPAAGSGRASSSTRIATWALAFVAVVLVGASVLKSESTAPLLDLAVLLLALAVPTGIAAFALARRPVVLAGAVAVLLAVPVVTAAPALIRERTFFGVHRVVASEGAHLLFSGTTLHGAQGMGRASLEPLSYYGRSGPIGQVLVEAGRGGPLDIAVVGLGTGALAAYGRPGDTFTFIEIDDAVVDIATDPAAFTYLERSDATIELVVGDGRLAIEHSDGRHDVIVLDAFTSDAIPVHLLTVEALAANLDKLEPGGLIAIHISNRYFDLQPVLGAAAAELGLAGRSRVHVPEEDDMELVTSSNWVLLARHEADLEPFTGDDDWNPLEAGARPWTDAFSDVLAALK